jgi:pentatricopeptide repeat protein
MQLQQQFSHSHAHRTHTAQGGEWQRAIGLLRAMNASNIAPDTISYGSALDACARQGHRLPAERLLKEMHKLNVPRSHFCYW